MDDREFNRYRQRMWDTCVNAMQDNLAVTLIVLNRDFGFGKKKLHRFLDAIVQNNQEFNGYSRDGLLDYKIKEYLEAIGVGYEEVYFKDDTTLDRYEQTEKKRKENAATIKEMYQKKRELEAMRSLLNK